MGRWVEAVRLGNSRGRPTSALAVAPGPAFSRYSAIMIRRLLGGLLLCLVIFGIVAKVRAVLPGAFPWPKPTPVDSRQHELTLSPSANDHRRRAPIDVPGAPPIPLDSLVRASARVRLGAEVQRHYLDSLFAGPDSFVRRWSIDAEPIALAIVPGGPQGYLPAMASEVRQALDSWSPAGVGLRFLEQRDTVGAAMVVRWTDSLEADRAGATDVTWDKAGRIRHVAIFLATRSPSTGRPFAPEVRRAIILHELGHALGLPHSTVRQDVMFPIATATDLTDRDRFSLRLLYELPTGWIGTTTQGVHR